LVYSNTGTYGKYLFDDNVYVARYNQKNIFRYTKSDGSPAFASDFTDWTKQTGQDANSTFIDTPLSEGETEQLFYNASKQPKSVNLGTEVFKDIYGKEVTGTITLQPFSSIILIGKDFSKVNENPAISDQSFNIFSPVFKNDTIGKLAVNDSYPEQILNYSIINGDETGWFSIDSTSGVIFCNENFQTSFILSFEFLVQISGNNAVNSLSDTATVTIFVKGKDVTPPEILSFDIPSLAFDLTFPVVSFSATDDVGVKGYMLTESFIAPNINDEDWVFEPPETYTFTEAGDYEVYAWARDSAGNISNPKKDSITVLIPDLSPTFSEYLFEEDSGTQIFDTHGSNNGMLLDDVMRVNGVNGSGLRFADSGYISLGQCFGENVQDEISISAWLKPDSSNNSYQGIVMHGGPHTVTFGLFLNSNTKIIEFVTNGTTSASFVTDNADKLWDGNWHHLAAVYNGEEKFMYIDGEIIAVVQAAGTIDPGYGYNLLIGAGSDENIPPFLYHGLLDEVRIYNYAVTSFEVGELFHPVNRELNKIATVENITICEGDEYLGWTQTGQYERV
jgi:hypothetical protein